MPLVEATSGWWYRGPDCPGSYANCQTPAQEHVSVGVTAYYDTNDARYYDEPSANVSCSARGFPIFGFDGGGPWIGGVDETTLNLYYEGQDADRGTFFWTEDNELEVIWFGRQESQNIIAFLRRAERQDRDVSMEVTSDYEAVNADFDVTGFIISFQRLPCS